MFPIPLRTDIGSATERPQPAQEDLLDLDPTSPDAPAPQPKTDAEMTTTTTEEYIDFPAQAEAAAASAEGAAEAQKPPLATDGGAGEV